MGILAGLASGVIGSLVDSVLGKVTGVFEAYFKKQISEAEMRAKVEEALLKSFAEVEVAHAEALAKTYDSFMKAAVQSPLMIAVWAAVTLSQLFVLVWHQIGIPAYVHMTGQAYPSSGSTVEWSYLLLGAMVGLGPIVLRAGPGSGGVAANLKSLVGKK